MTRMKIMVFVLGTALALLVPAVAQAQTVVVNNTSSTNSTSSATTPGQSASTTTSGVGSTGVAVSGGVDTLDVDSTGSSNSAATSGPTGASAVSNSTNESDVSLDCAAFGCGATIVCEGTVCTNVITPGTIFNPGTIIIDDDDDPDVDTCIGSGLLGNVLCDLDLGLTDTLDLTDTLNDVLSGSSVLTDLLADLGLNIGDILGGGLI